MTNEIMNIRFFIVEKKVQRKSKQNQQNIQSNIYNHNIINRIIAIPNLKVY